VGGRQARVARGGDGGDTARHFVNALSVKVSLSSIHFDLAALGSQTESRGMVWQFSTTPSGFRSMHARLGEAIDTYRANFGEGLPQDPLAEPEGGHG
jgi:hypothetical protein